MSIGQAGEDENHPKGDGEEFGWIEHCVGGCSNSWWLFVVSCNILGYQGLLIEKVCLCPDVLIYLGKEKQDLDSPTAYIASESAVLHVT